MSFESLESHRNPNASQQGQEWQMQPGYPPQTEIVDGMTVDSSLHNPNMEEPSFEGDPATPEQVEGIIADARDMVDALPTVRHTEKDKLDPVDVDEVLLPDATVKHIAGEAGDVTVIEPHGEDGRTSLVVIDNAEGMVYIDGKLADKHGADSVASVIQAIRNEHIPPDEAAAGAMSEQQTPENTESQPVKVEQEVVPQATTVSEAELKRAEQEKKQKIQLIGGVSQFLRTKNGDMALKQLAVEMELKPQDLQERMKKGDITLTPDSVKAFQELMRSGARPDSPIWREDTRNPSMLGGAARESQQLLSRVLRSMF